MTDKNWKARERKTAAALNGKRIPVTGERHGADIETPLLCVQHKHGRDRPGYMGEWLDGICATAQRCDKVGIVVWSANRERHEDAIVLMRLRDFQQLHGTLPKSADQIVGAQESE